VSVIVHLKKLLQMNNLTDTSMVGDSVYL